MAINRFKRFTHSFFFRNVESIFLIFLVFILVGGITVYFSYGFTRANTEMHSLSTTTDSEYLFDIINRLDESAYQIQVINPNAGKYKSLEFQLYEIKHGDSLNKIASKYKVSFDTLVSINNIKDSRSISVGRVIAVPNQTGVYYRVMRNDSLRNLSKIFSNRNNNTPIIKEEAIKYVNDIETDDILAGELLFIPGGQLTRNEREKVMGLEYAVPVVGRVVSGVGFRMDPFNGKLSFHPGVDIAASYGTPVYAGKAGRITLAGDYGGYGLCVIIEHAGGYETRYGHLSSIHVRQGMWVDRNRLIGRVGSTGRSLGPHLHFEVRHHDKIINPFKYHGLNRRQWTRQLNTRP